MVILCECVFKNFLIKKILKNFGESLSFGKWNWRCKPSVKVLLEFPQLTSALSNPHLTQISKALEKPPGRKSAQIPTVVI